MQLRTPIFINLFFGLSWPLLIGAITFLFLFNLPALLNDGDTLWHVATGQWIIDHKSVPVVDPFSFTFLNRPWTAHEWFADVMFATAYSAAGWDGVVIFTACAYSFAFALLARYLLKYFEPIYVLLITGMAASLTMPHMLARPHALIIPLLVFWAIVLVRAREVSLAPALWLSLLVIMWANLHGSFPLAIALAFAFAVEAVLDAEVSERKGVTKSWAKFLLLTLFATLLTPHGLDGWRFVLYVNQMTFSTSMIGEWRAPNFSKYEPLELFLLISIFFILVRGLKLSLLRIGLLLVLLHLALKHGRHGELLALLAPIIVAQPFSVQLVKTENSGRQGMVLDIFFAKLAKPATAVTTFIVVAVLALFAFRTIETNSLKPAGAAAPVAALEAAKAAGIVGPVFNAYEFGGFLIFSGFSPYIDARADLYGDAFMKEYYAATMQSQSDLLKPILEKHKMEWTLLQPALPAVATLDRLSGWKRIYADENAVVHMRQK